MKWVQERDLLIAQTMAFVQSVSGMKPMVQVPKTKTQEPTPAAKVEALVQTVLSAPVDQRVIDTPWTPLAPQKDLRQEIQSRVALFRAHQQRFHKERDQHYVSTMAQLRSSNKSQPGLPLA